MAWKGGKKGRKGGGNQYRSAPGACRAILALTAAGKAPRARLRGGTERLAPPDDPFKPGCRFKATFAALLGGRVGGGLAYPAVLRTLEATILSYNRTCPIHTGDWGCFRRGGGNPQTTTLREGPSLEKNQPSSLRSPAATQC